MQNDNLSSDQSALVKNLHQNIMDGLFSKNPDLSRAYHPAELNVPSLVQLWHEYAQGMQSGIGNIGEYIQENINSVQQQKNKYIQAGEESAAQQSATEAVSESLKSSIEEALSPKIEALEAQEQSSLQEIASIEALQNALRSPDVQWSIDNLENQLTYPSVEELQHQLNAIVMNASSLSQEHQELLSNIVTNENAVLIDTEHNAYNQESFLASEEQKLLSEIATQEQEILAHENIKKDIASRAKELVELKAQLQINQKLIENLTKKASAAQEDLAKAQQIYDNIVSSIDQENKIDQSPVQDAIFEEEAQDNSSIEQISESQDEKALNQPEALLNRAQKQEDEGSNANNGGLGALIDEDDAPIAKGLSLADELAALEEDEYREQSAESQDDDGNLSILNSEAYTESDHAITYRDEYSVVTAMEEAQTEKKDDSVSTVLHEIMSVQGEQNMRDALEEHTASEEDSQNDDDDNKDNIFSPDVDKYIGELEEAFKTGEHPIEDGIASVPGHIEQLPRTLSDEGATELIRHIKNENNLLASESQEVSRVETESAIASDEAFIRENETLLDDDERTKVMHDASRRKDIDDDKASSVRQTVLGTEHSQRIGCELQDSAPEGKSLDILDDQTEVTFGNIKIEQDISANTNVQNLPDASGHTEKEDDSLSAVSSATMSLQGEQNMRDALEEHTASEEDSQNDDDDNKDNIFSPDVGKYIGELEEAFKTGEHPIEGGIASVPGHIEQLQRTLSDEGATELMGHIKNENNLLASESQEVSRVETESAIASDEAFIRENGTLLDDDERTKVMHDASRRKDIDDDKASSVRQTVLGTEHSQRIGYELQDSGLEGKSVDISDAQTELEGENVAIEKGGSGNISLQIPDIPVAEDEHQTNLVTQLSKNVSDTILSVQGDAPDMADHASQKGAKESEAEIVQAVEVRNDSPGAGASLMMEESVSLVDTESVIANERSASEEYIHQDNNELEAVSNGDTIEASPTNVDDTTSQISDSDFINHEIIDIKQLRDSPDMPDDSAQIVGLDTENADNWRVHMYIIPVVEERPEIEFTEQVVDPGPTSDLASKSEYPYTVERLKKDDDSSSEGASDYDTNYTDNGESERDFESDLEFNKEIQDNSGDTRNASRNGQMGDDTKKELLDSEERNPVSVSVSNYAGNKQSKQNKNSEIDLSDTDLPLLFSEEEQVNGIMEDSAQVFGEENAPLDDVDNDKNIEPLRARWEIQGPDQNLLNSSLDNNHDYADFADLSVESNVDDDFENIESSAENDARSNGGDSKATYYANYPQHRDNLDSESNDSEYEDCNYLSTKDTEEDVDSDTVNGEDYYENKNLELSKLQNQSRRKKISAIALERQDSPLLSAKPEEQVELKAIIENPCPAFIAKDVTTLAMEKEAEISSSSKTQEESPAHHLNNVLQSASHDEDEAGEDEAVDRPKTGDVVSNIDQEDMQTTIVTQENTVLDSPESAPEMQVEKAVADVIKPLDAEEGVEESIIHKAMIVMPALPTASNESKSDDAQFALDDEDMFQLADGRIIRRPEGMTKSKFIHLKGILTSPAGGYHTSMCNEIEITIMQKLVAKELSYDILHVQEAIYGLLMQASPDVDGDAKAILESSMLGDLILE